MVTEFERQVSALSDAYAEIDDLREQLATAVLARDNAIKAVEEAYEHGYSTAAGSRDAALQRTRERQAAMTAALDEALRLLEGAVEELAELEEDPAMLDGHRARIAALREVGK
jgi:chaperonin cofactor prefoldin